MNGKLFLGFVVGAAVGGAVVIALLPEPRQRLRELTARLAEIDGLEQASREALRLGREALDAAEARYRLALAEANEARLQAQRELQARFEVARRRGQLPPGQL